MSNSTANFSELSPKDSFLLDLDSTNATKNKVLSLLITSPSQEML
jgi:hypothetical protein